MNQPLEQIADPLQGAIATTLARVPGLASVLHGDFIGHPLHAALSDVPVGAWTTAAALDGLGATTGSRGFRLGADAAIGLGLAATAMVIASGFADWSTVLDTKAKRLGFLHGILNLAVTGLMAGSLACRLRSSRRAGVALSTAGLALAGLTAWMGGELSFAHGVGVRSRNVNVS
ncbi:MAG: DUF2231 domain-containing protein [Polyangiales bacterium]